MKIYIEIAVPDNWETRLDTRTYIEREIAADGWAWRLSQPVPQAPVTDDEINTAFDALDLLRESTTVEEMGRALEGFAAGRAAHEPMTPQQIKWKLGFDRYEKARKLNPVQWAALHRRNLAGKIFDDMIDALGSDATEKRLGIGVDAP